MARANVELLLIRLISAHSCLTSLVSPTAYSDQTSPESKSLCPPVFCRTLQLDQGIINVREPAARQAIRLAPVALLGSRRFVQDGSKRRPRVHPFIRSWADLPGPAPRLEDLQQSQSIMRTAFNALSSQPTATCQSGLVEPVGLEAIFLTHDQGFTQLHEGATSQRVGMCDAMTCNLPPWLRCRLPPERITRSFTNGEPRATESSLQETTCNAAPAAKEKVDHEDWVHPSLAWTMDKGGIGSCRHAHVHSCPQPR